MSAVFVGASSTRLENANSPITGYPCSVGCWVKRTTSEGVNRNIWAVSNSGTAGELIRFGIGAADEVTLACTAGGTVSFVLGGTWTLNGWDYVVARFISATNRRISTLHAGGSISHAFDNVSKSPSGMNTMTLGARNNGGTIDLKMTGGVAEFWYTNTDIQADGAQLQDSTLRTLALYGPWSLPHIARDIIEYRKFRSCLDTRQDNPEEVYHRGLRQTWTNTNWVSLGPHPPQADNYYGPIPEQDALVLV